MARPASGLARGCACALTLACAGAPGEPPPHIVLIVVDTLRADHLGSYGYDRPTSPNIDRLAAAGVLFTRAWAPSSWTKPSMASLFTSLPPSKHGATAFARHLDPTAPTLAELLAAGGYRTVGVTANFVHVNHTSGLARGFDAFRSLSQRLDGADQDSLLSLSTGGQTVELRAPAADEVNREVFRLLPPVAERPLFLYVHYMEPHAGYAPPPRFAAAFARDGPSGAAPVSSAEVVELAAAGTHLEGASLRRLIDLYDGEIAAVDSAIALLLAELDRRGFLRDALVALVSDHGEEFGEHGGWFHGLNLHAESLRVPLVLHDTRRPRSAERRDEPVDLIDVPTTLLSLAGVEIPESMEGRALLGAGPLPDRDLVAELHPDPRFEEHVREREQRIALVRWPWKLIATRDGARQVYRIDRDPLEQHPLSGGGPAAPEALRDRLAALERESAGRDAGDPVGLDPDAARGLRALGYVR